MASSVHSVCKSLLVAKFFKSHKILTLLIYPKKPAGRRERRTLLSAGVQQFTVIVAQVAVNAKESVLRGSNKLRREFLSLQSM